MHATSESNPTNVGYFWYDGHLYNSATMKGSRSAELVRQEIIRLCHAGLDSRTFRIESVKRLKKAIPVDASFFATADPATLLFTGAVLDDVLVSATTQFLGRSLPRAAHHA